METRTITYAYINQFHAKLRQDEKSTATIEKYLRDVRKFFAFSEDGKISKELVIRYKQYLMEHYAPASVNSMLASVNSFLKTVGLRECVVKALKIQRQTFRARERELSKEEYFRLLAAAKRRKDPRLNLLLQTICATGIRVGELRFITVDAIHQGKAVVSLKGKTRQVLIPSALCRELKRYIRMRGIHAGSVFISKHGNPLDRSNILHEMKSLCEEAHVERGKVFPHNLRHLFACIYYKASKDISRLADILGHSSINTTRIYTSVSCEEQKREIERLGLLIQNTT